MDRAEKYARENRNRRGPRTPKDRRWPVDVLVRSYGSVLGLETALAAGGVPVRINPTRMLPDVTADKYALALGHHPEHFWPGWIDVALTPLDDVFINGNGWRPAWELAQETGLKGFGADTCSTTVVSAEVCPATLGTSGAPASNLTRGADVSDDTRLHRPSANGVMR